MQGYSTPTVLKKIPVCLESPILAGSIVDKTDVKTTGQDKAGFYDDAASFNHTWGD